MMGMPWGSNVKRWHGLIFRFNARAASVSWSGDRFELAIRWWPYPWIWLWRW